MPEDPTRLIGPVRRLKLSDSVAAELERMITRGDFGVGEKLPPERVLADRFGVGRSSMREALRLVEAAGLLRIDHGVGVFVVSRSRQARASSLDLLVALEDVTVPELFEVRLALERDAAALAARRITPSEAAELQTLIAEASDPRLSDEEFIERDVALHMTVCKATKNALLMRIYETLKPLLLT